MNGSARWINAVLGGWLFVSAFVWHHGPVQFTNTWVMGLIILGISLFLGSVPWARYLNVAAAFYLFFSTLFMPRYNVGTVWHNCILAVLVFFFAMTPTRGEHRIQPHAKA